MEYNTKLIFHIPRYTKLNDRLIQTVYSDFQSILIKRFNHECDCKIQLSQTKVYRFQKLLDESLLVVHCSSEDVTKLTKIFMQSVCGYHSDLMQDEYQYEINDILVAIKGVVSKWL